MGSLVPFTTKRLKITFSGATNLDSRPREPLNPEPLIPERIICEYIGIIRGKLEAFRYEFYLFSIGT